MLPVSKYSVVKEKELLIAYFNGCNLNCPFCYCKEFVEKTDNGFTFSDILSYIDNNAIKNIYLTGGEPLLQDELVPFLRELRSRKIFIKMKTNGTLPSQLKYIIDEWLVDYVSLSVKSSSNKYNVAVGKKINFDLIISSVSILMNWAGEQEYKIIPVHDIVEKEDLEQLSKLLANGRKIVIGELCAGNIQKEFFDKKYDLKELDEIKKLFPDTEVFIKKC